MDQQERALGELRREATGWVVDGGTRLTFTTRLAPDAGVRILRS